MAPDSPIVQSSMGHTALAVEVKLAVLCDYAIVGQDGKISVLGIFSEFGSPNFPVSMPPFYFVSTFEAQPGEFEQEKSTSIVYMDSEARRLGVLEQSFTVPRPPPGRRSLVNQVVRMEGVVVPHEGTYAFEIQVGGETKTTVQMWANKTGGGA